MEIYGFQSLPLTRYKLDFSSVRQNRELIFEYLMKEIRVGDSFLWLFIFCQHLCCQLIIAIICSFNQIWRFRINIVQGKIVHCLYAVVYRLVTSAYFASNFFSQSFLRFSAFLKRFNASSFVSFIIHSFAISMQRYGLYI